MPPPIVESDAESVADDRSSTPKPASASGQAKEELNDAVMEDAKAKDEVEDAGDADEEDDEDGDEEVYVVEKILDHRTDFADNKLRYWIKWKGYEKKADRTWEPIENLADSREILEEYWESIGGEPTAAEPRPKKTGRKSLTGKRSASNLKADAEAEDDESPAPKKQKQKPGRKSAVKDDDEPTEFRGYTKEGSDDWKPPAPKKDAWDERLMKVDTIEQDDSGERWVYLCWTDKSKDGTHYRSKARLQTVYKAAPQKMLYFYEQHLVFTAAENSHQRRANGLEGTDE